MELINSKLTPSNRKRTFIASMTLYNPYRIPSIKESVYDRILMNREIAAEVIKEIPRDPKAIYLPPVRTEETAGKPKGKSHQTRHFPASVDSTPKNHKIDSFQVISRSVDFNYDIENSLMRGREKRKSHGGELNVNYKAKEKIEARVKTMSFFLEKEGKFLANPRLKTSRSPWIFKDYKLCNGN